MQYTALTLRAAGRYAVTIFMGATETRVIAPLSFETDPAHYRHWKLTFDGPVATLAMDVREDAGLSPDYRL